MDSSPAASTTTHILDVNDDCLREIFGISELADLSVVADVCFRFRCLSKELCIRSNSGKLELHKVYRKEENPKKSLRRAAIFFRNFGAFVESIDLDIVDGDCLPAKNNICIIELIVDYCSETINELNFRKFKFNTYDDFVQCFNLMSKLTRLKILRLERFRLRRFHYVALCENHKELTELYIDQSEVKLDSDTIFRMIRAAPNLRLLQYDYNHEIYAYKRWGDAYNREKYAYKQRTIDELFYRCPTYSALLELVKQRGVPLTIILVNPRLSEDFRGAHAMLDRSHDNILRMIHRDYREQ